MVNTMKAKGTALAACLVFVIALAPRISVASGTDIQAGSRQMPAVNYQARSGSTRIDFRGTELMPKATGKAKIESKQGYVSIEAEFENLSIATTFGNEYLTYVLWTATPEGRSANVGELVLDGNRSKLKVTTRLQAFALFVTAEPYFAVSQPSKVAVLENVVREDTVGNVVMVAPKSDLIGNGYAPSDYKFEPIGVDSGQPPEFLQIQNARRIAQLAQADKYASDSFQRAEAVYRQVAEYAVQKKTPTKALSTSARQAIQAYEDSRVIAVKQKAEELEEAQRRSDAERVAAARAAAEEESRRRAQADEENRASAQRASDAKKAAEAAEREREIAEQQRQQADQEKKALRAKILTQLNQVLATQDTGRGLVATMADILFDTGKYELRPAAREKLAQFSGILMAYQGLNIMIEGYTDDTGSEPLNQRLSEQRAESVRQYLVSLGIDDGRTASQGLGEAEPRVPNDSVTNRQLNRRVELVISGEVIGTQVGGSGGQ